MAGSVPQGYEHTDVPSGTTSIVAATLTGNGIVAACTNDNSVAATITAGDPTNGATSYTLLDDVVDTGDQQRMTTFAKAASTASGSVNVTFTWSAANAFKAGLVVDCSGVAGALDQHTAQYQPTPTLTTDAQTSGSTGALNGAAASGALVVGIGFNSNGTSAPNQGSTGWSPPVAGAATFWSFGGALQTRVEFKRVTSTAAVAALFTATSNTNSITAVVVIDETGGGGGSVTTLTEDQRAAGHPYLPPTKSAYPIAQAPDPVGARISSTGPWFQCDPTIVGSRVRVPPPHWPLPEAWVPPPIVIVPPVLASALPDPWRPPQRRQAPDAILEDTPGPRLPIVAPMGWQTSTSSPQRQTLKQPRLDTVPFVQAATATLRSFFSDAPPSYRRPLPPPTRSPFQSLFDTRMAFVSRYPYTSSGRKMFDQQGLPFRVKGRTAWGLAGLTVSLRQAFLDDTISWGFNAVEAQIPTHLSHINNVPQDGAGNLPFLKRLDGTTWTGGLSPFGSPHTEAPDFTTPNPTFWAFADGIVQDCYTRNILLFMFPAYLGDGSGDGWQDEMQANIDVLGDTSIITYGAFIANRYKSFPNIVWCTAGDTASGFDPENDLITGLQSISGQASGPNFTSERAGGQISTDGSGPLGASTTLNGAYDWATVMLQCQRAYSFASPVMPGFMIEEPYDQEGTDGTGVNTSFSTQPVRRYEWAGWLNVIGGYIAGNGYVWRFALTGSPTPTDDYRNHLNTQNTQDLGRLNAFMELWPDTNDLIPGGLTGMRTLIVSGAGTIDTDNYVCAAQTSTGTLMICYSSIGASGTFSVDLRSMGPRALKARWWDPTNATFSTNTSAAGTFTLSNSASSQSFTTPGNNSAGDPDWVLVLEEQPAASLPWGFYEPLVARPWRAARRAIAALTDWFLPPLAVAAQPGALDTPRSSTMAPAMPRPIAEAWSGQPLAALGGLPEAARPRGTGATPPPRSPADPFALPPSSAVSSSIGDSWVPSDSPPPRPPITEPFAPPPPLAAPADGGGPAPAPPAARHQVGAGEPWFLSPPASAPPSDVLDGSALPPARRAPPHLDVPWFAPPLLVASSPWFEQSPVRSQQPRGQAQYEGQWLPTALPPPNTPEGWNIYPPRSGAPARPIQDLAGWILPPLASLAALPWESSARPTKAATTRAVESWSLVALAPPVLAFPDPASLAPARGHARPLVDDGTAFRLLATPLPSALNDSIIARPLARRPQLVEPWTAPPLVTFVPGGMPDPTPAPPRPAPIHTLQEPLFSALLGPPLAPWYEESITRGQQPRGRIFDWWFMTPIIVFRPVPWARPRSGPTTGGTTFRGPTRGDR